MKQTYPSVFFAFLDILGFKEIVLNTDHAKLEVLYLDTLPVNIDGALAGGRFRILDQNGKKSQVPDTQRASVNSLLVSDSIMMWTEDDSMGAFINVVAAVRHIMAYSLFCGMPLRGAISIGPLTMFVGRTPSPKLIFQHTLVGKPIVETAVAEKQKQWSGCMITQPAIDCYVNHYASRTNVSSNLATLEFVIEKKFILRYPVAMQIKGGKVIEEEHYVVDWVSGSKAPVWTSSVIKAFSMHGKSVDDPTIKAKMENTIKFVRHVNPAADKDKLMNTVRVP